MVYNVPDIKINISLQSKQHISVCIVVRWVYTENHLNDEIEIERGYQKEELSFILQWMLDLLGM